MMTESTKYYSSRQEHMVADYLNWKVVAGSGARSFHPGDVRSDDFLGECKTFTEESDVVYCYNSVWSKITEEATAVMKSPVLFVDNGTQLSKNTWCIIPKRVAAAIPDISYLDKTVAHSLLKISTTRVSFSHTAMKYQFMMHKRIANTELIALPFILDSTDVLLISLSCMKAIVEGE